MSDCVSICVCVSSDASYLLLNFIWDEGPETELAAATLLLMSQSAACVCVWRHISYTFNLATITPIKLHLMLCRWLMYGGSERSNLCRSTVFVFVFFCKCCICVVKLLKPFYWLDYVVYICMCLFKLQCVERLLLSSIITSTDNHCVHITATVYVQLDPVCVTGDIWKPVTVV